MVGRPGILESERHDGIAVRTKRHVERRLDLVVFLEGYLVIAGVTIEEGEQFVASGGVYNLVYSRQTEGVFRAVFVKIRVITFSILYSVFEREQGLLTTKDDTLLL